MKFGLKENIIEQVNSVFEKYLEIEEVIIYGSRAKGNFKPGSDIDMVIKGKDVSHSLINRISLDIDDLYLPYTFDIARYSVLNETLSKNISTAGKIFYRGKNFEVKKMIKLK